MKTYKPHEIEARSFEIIQELLGSRALDKEQEPVIKRVIHTTADFDYVDSLYFSPGAVKKAVEALKRGAHIVTDTNMAASGINKSTLQKLGGRAHCFMADEDVAKEAARRQVTRAVVCMEKAAELDGEVVIAVGNAPTALIRLRELVDEGAISPVLVIGVPVGFVNVVEAKELFVETATPAIVARGRKGGSNVAAAICNALLYTALPGR